VLESDGNAYVEKWTGSGWQMVERAVNAVSKQKVTAVAIALNATGDPSVALVEPDAGGHASLYLAQHTASGWNWLPTAIAPVNDSSGQDVNSPSIQVDSHGNPVVDFARVDTTSSYVAGYAYRWNGSKWAAIGGAISNGVGVDVSS